MTRTVSADGSFECLAIDRDGARGETIRCKPSGAPQNGTRAITNSALAANGATLSVETRIVSADGQTTQTRLDVNGNALIDRVTRETTVKDAAGIETESHAGARPQQCGAAASGAFACEPQCAQRQAKRRWRTTKGFTGAISISSYSPISVLSASARKSPAQRR
jgi:hypothetical protein